MNYAVTGSTGQFGTAAISHLIQAGIEPSSIIALARDEQKAAPLTSKGVQVRIGNYDDLKSIESALQGVDRVLLVSSSEVGKRYSQHLNVIEAAKKSGVKQIVYTSLTKAEVSVNPLAPEHKSTEEALIESGLDYVILRNNWYLENYLGDIQYAQESASIATATAEGTVASAVRDEYAEAAAKVLTSDGHSAKTYELAGKPWDFNQLAEAAGNIFGKKIVYSPITKDERIQNLISAGMDEGTAGFYAALDDSIAQGSLAIESGDLAELLGRSPLTLEEGLKSLLNL